MSSIIQLSGNNILQGCVQIVKFINEHTDQVVHFLDLIDNLKISCTLLPRLVRMRIIKLTSFS